MNEASDNVVLVPQTGQTGIADASDGKNLEGTRAGPVQPEFALPVNSDGFATPSVANSELGASELLSQRPPKGAKNPRTDRRLKHGRNVRWLHIAVAPQPKPLEPTGSPEYEPHKRALAIRLQEEGYRIGDMPPAKLVPIKKIKGRTYRRPVPNFSSALPADKNLEGSDAPPVQVENVREQNSEGSTTVQGA
jgi:hypothetical protein